MIATNHLPQSEEGQRFCQFFTHRFNFIKAPNTGSDSPEWQTISAYPIEHRNLWNAYRDPNTFIGLSFDKKTHYALLDIDTRSPYHPSKNEQLFKDLLGAYEDVGFNEFITLQSSWNGGIHVYLVLPKEVSTYYLAVMLRLTAIRSGFKVKDGTLEIFPNAKPYSEKKPTSYKAHRLPLQEGSFLLDNNFEPYSNSIKTFLELAESAAKAQDIDLIETAIEAADKAKAFRHIKGDGTKAAEFAKDLKEQFQEGWTDFGQTNDLLRVIGTYGRVFEALEGKALADYIANTAQSLPGYREFCRHQHHIHRRAADWARCIEKFYYPYGSKPVRAGTFQELVTKGAKENTVNNDRQKGAVDRIKAGVEHLRQKLDELPKKVGEMKDALLNAISSLFNVRPSDKTLNKHRDLWHPSFLLEEEVVVVPESLQEEVQETVERNEEGETPTEPSPGPEPAPEAQSEPCHTPPAEEAKNGPAPKPPEALPAVPSEESAPPPLYMKVRDWTDSQIVLVYEGTQCSGLVSLEGKKREIIQSIYSNQTVVIDCCEHSSFLFHPDDEQNLLVYVKPSDSSLTWKSGIAVLARYLNPSSQ